MILVSKETFANIDNITKCDAINAVCTFVFMKNTENKDMF